MGFSLPGSSVHGIFQARIPGVGSRSLPQRISPTQGSNPGLPHCKWIVYHLSHQGSSYVLYSVRSSCLVLSDSLWPHGLQHAKLPSPSPTLGAYTNSCPLCRWCHPTSSSSVVPFPSCLQSFPESWSFQMSQFFTSGGQSIGVSASASVLPMSIQEWFPFRWTDWIFLQSKELSRIFSNTTVQKHQFFSAQLSL